MGNVDWNARCDRLCKEMVLQKMTREVAMGHLERVQREGLTNPALIERIKTTILTLTHESD